MSIVNTLVSLGLRQLFDSVGEQFMRIAEAHLTDHTQTLPKALGRANDRAWQAVALALGAGGFLGKLKGFFADADLKTVRDLIREFLERTPTGFTGLAEDLRADCLAEWQRLRKTDRLVLGAVSAPTLARSAASVQRFSDPSDLAREGTLAVQRIADALQSDAPRLARVLRSVPTGGGPPLLVAAFMFFLRREIEENQALAHGLTIDSLRRLTANLDERFSSLQRAVGCLDTRFDLLFDAMNDGFERLAEEFRSLHAKVDRIIEHNQVRHAAHDPLAVSVTNEHERAFLRQVRERYRALPATMVGAGDWALLGDGLAAAGEFTDARACHQQALAVVQAGSDRSKEAEQSFKAYRATCEGRHWADALPLLLRAAELDPARFRPFDLRRYEVIRILGAGGFGTVFHCRDRYRKDSQGHAAEVAIKALHTADLDRNLDDVFSEAHHLNRLNHPGIIGVIDQNFGDPDRQRRPYFVLEYFPAPTLERRLREQGELSLDDFLVVARLIAEAVHAAHQVGICHRDLKPANILTHKGDDGTWQVKVIDFGLAVRVAAAVQASSALAGPCAALRDRSFAGTLEYAAPEQKGKMAGVGVGPYSDVYSFGKTCLEALMGTTEVVGDHWDELADPRRDALRKLVERCIVPDLSRRFASFEPVMATLHELSRQPAPIVVPVVPVATRASTSKTRATPPPLPWNGTSISSRKPGEILVLSIPLPARDERRKPGERLTLSIPVPSN